MAADAAAALSLTGLSKEFGGLRAVDGVSLTVGAGERRAIIGPNGAGKTTLFSLISGETRPSGGHIALFGRDVTRAAPHRRASLGLARTYQITNLFPLYREHVSAPEYRAARRRAFAVWAEVSGVAAAA